MCDLVVSIARNHLLPLLAEAANIMRRAPVEVDAMKKQLERVQEMIHEVDRKASAEGDNLKRDEIKEMLKELIEASFQMEDVLDEYIMCDKHLQSRDPRCAFNPEGAANFIRPMITRVQLAYKIQQLNPRVDEIKKRCKIHEEGQGGSSSGEHQDTIVRNLREEAPLYIKEVDVVGFDVPKAKLIDWLVNGQGDRTVVSVVGMGGQGKTTLARKVCESKEVVAHFDCHVWITVSQTFSIEALLKDMLRHFYKDKSNVDFSGKDRKSLEHEVRNHLQHKRYVVFLDDIWDTKVWDEIEYVIIDNKNGSRIFITTRKTEVALHFKKSSIVKLHHLQLLDENESFELFCKKEFHSDFAGVCPKELKDVSSEIVTKCDGLPLAIAVIGGVLSTKDPSPSEWIKFSKHLFVELENDPRLDVVAKILSLSYDDLSSYLKPCLLYFGMYPEDFAVNSKRLIRQWIAEGFVKEQKANTLEEVAEGYLKELIQRSLVQVSSFTLDGKVKSCRVHDMVREIILRKMEDLNFGRQDYLSALGGKSRRLSVATNSETSLESIESSHIRSLLVFTRIESDAEPLLKRIIPQCKLLKVLDFQSTFFGRTFPKSFLNLLHLKYLSFCGKTVINNLLETIVKFENLETLDLRNTIYLSLPMEFSKLRKLRHLLGVLECIDSRNNCIGGLEFLQTLKELRIRGVEGLGELTHMRNLALEFGGFKEEESRLLWNLINKMQHLEKLSLSALGYQFHELYRISPRPALQKLCLKGGLERLPKWISELPNLVKLTLQCTHLTYDPLSSLKKLPNLLSLTMYDCYEGGSLHFEDGDFHKLKQLDLQYMRRLNSMVIDKGALHSLKELRLERIPGLKAVPSGIQHLEELEVLALYYMQSELVDRISSDRGRDYWIIKHVPRVDISTGFH